MGKKIAVPIRSFLGWFRIASDDYDRLIFALSVCLLVFLFVGVTFGFLFGFLGRKVVSTKNEGNLITLKNDKPALTLQSPEE